MWWLFNSTMSFKLISQHYIVRKSPPFSFICLFFYLQSIWTHEFLLFTVDYNLLFILMLKWSVTHGEIFQAAPMLFWHVSPIFWSTSLLSGVRGCSRLILYHLCPSRVMVCFSRETPGSFLRRVEFRNQNPNASCAHCYWHGIPSRSFQHMKLDYERSLYPYL